MSEFTTGIAEIVQGSLAARAAEPTGGAAAAADGHTHESACLNCGTRLIGSHCHACGQPAHVHRTLGAFFHDLAHGVYHVEGKVWRTLPALVLRPGRMTREYIDGRRASYVSPIALFLFAVFLLFGAFHLLEGEHAGVHNIYSSVDEALADQQHRLDELTHRRTAGRDEDAVELDRQITGTRKAIEGLKSVKASGISGKFVAGDGPVHSDIPFIERAVKTFEANPDLAIYQLQSSAYKYSWLLIPLSVPLVWLLFPFSRRFKLYDHTVFVTYSITFMTLFAVVLMLLDEVGVPQLWLAVLVIPAVHMYHQLKGTYGLTRGGALCRTAVLAVFCAATLVLFATALVGLGLGA